MGGAVGFLIGGVPGALTGTLIGCTLGILFDTFHFDHDGKIDVSEVVGVLLPAVAGAAGLVFGGIVGGAAMFTLGAVLTLYFDHMKTVWDNVDMDTVYPFLSDQWISQKIKAAKDSITTGFNNQIKPIFKTFWQQTIMDVEEIGQKIKGIWGDIRSWFEQKWVDFKKWWESLSLNAFKVKLPHFTATGSFSLSPLSVPKISVDWYANGGFPSVGDLFIAGERGAEIVSSHGGQTQVSNTDQIARSVYEGNGVVVRAIDDMASAVVRAINNKDMNFYLDSRQIRNGQNRLIRENG